MLQVEIHPQTGWTIPKSDLVIIDAKSGSNGHNYIRNLIEYFLTIDELISIGTANNVFKKHKTLKSAITGYIQTKLNIIIPSVEFTKVVNRRIRVLKNEKFMTQEEKNAIKEKKRKAVKACRDDKKLIKRPNENGGDNRQQDTCVSLPELSPARWPSASATNGIEEPFDPEDSTHILLSFTDIPGPVLTSSCTKSAKNLTHSYDISPYVDKQMNHYYQPPPLVNQYPASHSSSTCGVISEAIGHDYNYNSSMNTNVAHQNFNNPLWSLQTL
ncbi:hypothetical protein PV326_007915 [Microctonus aethiopoides]|nr:hypothetical protein PV326_007915 [Microctonus aethiopoides]